MPLFVEAVSPIRTAETVYLMVLFAVNIFKDIRARLTITNFIQLVSL